MKRPVIITVSGAYGGVSKTRLIERLLPVLPASTAVKVRTQDAGPATAHEEPSSEANADKDTGRYLAAGAERAFLLTGPPDEALRLAQDLIATSTGGGVVFETDSLAPRLEPDLAVFVAGPGEWKPGAEKIRAQAHVVVTETH